ncbi:MAG: HDOD domain-containing protein [Myxococcota bacterium]
MPATTASRGASDRSPHDRFSPQALAQFLVLQLSEDRADLPVLPRIAVEVWDMARDPDVDFDRLRVALEREPVLAGRVLGVAHGAQYATKVPPQSIHDALTRLGQRVVADILFEVTATMSVFREPAYTPAMDLLQRHALAVAYLARDLMDMMGDRSGSAFVAGLLHDVGTVALLRVVAARERRARRPAPPVSVLAPAIDALSVRTGAHLALRWGLPQDIVAAIGAQKTLLVEDEPCRLAAAIALADGLTAEAGLADLEGHDDQTELAATVLGCSKEGLERARARSCEIVRHLLSG